MRFELAAQLGVSQPQFKCAAAAAAADGEAKGKDPFLLGGECAQTSSGCGHISGSARQTQLAAASGAVETAVDSEPGLGPAQLCTGARPDPGLGLQSAEARFPPLLKGITVRPIVRD